MERRESTTDAKEDGMYRVFYRCLSVTNGQRIPGRPGKLHRTYASILTAEQPQSNPATDWTLNQEHQTVQMTAVSQEKAVPMNSETSMSI